MSKGKLWTSLTGVFAAMFLFAGMASAHVTVQPTEAPQGSYQVFTVRVPSEKEGTFTTAVKVAMPEGVSISRVEPKPGWTYTMEKREDGTAASLTWTAEGDGLGETEFTEFRMQGKVAAEAADLVWKANQTYADGEVVDWVGAEGSDKPAPITVVTAAAAGDGDGHGAAAPADADDSDGSAADTAATVAAYAGLALGLIALIAALASRRKRA